MENKEIKQEKKDINLSSNDEILKALNSVKEELKTLKESKKEKVEVEKFDDNFNSKKQYENDSINIKQINLEPFNELNNFIFNHKESNK